MATDQLMARDTVIRQAAFDQIRGLQSRDLILSHEDIARGFMFEGERWPLWNPGAASSSLRSMPFLLSIRTVFPRKGGRVWYDDQRHVHQQIFAGNDQLDYAFMDTDPEAPEDVWLREAAERQIPLIYFLGVSPGRYQAIIPTFVVGWDPRRLTAPVVASYESAFCCPTVALSCQSILETDAPCRIRTCDLRIRSPLLYPAELRAHACEIPRSAGARQSSGAIAPVQSRSH
jgi:hypothetical protein